MSDRKPRWLSKGGRPYQKWLRFKRWWAYIRHVPHPRVVWCGDMYCPYAEEAKR